MATPTVRHVLRVSGRVLLGGQQIAEAGRVRFDQQNLGARRDGVRPLDVEADLERPPRVNTRIRRTTGLVDLREATIPSGAGGKPVLAAEAAQVALSGRIIIGVDDRDRLPGTGRRVRREPVDRLHRRRRQPRRRGRGLSPDSPATIGHVREAPRVPRQRAATHQMM